MATGRRFCFTSYNVNQLKNLEIHDNIKYMVWQTEICPRTKRIHAQGYLETKLSIRPLGAKKLLGDKTVHIELAKGNADQCVAYCTKEESQAPADQYHRHESGERSTQGKRGDIDTFIEAAKRGASDHQLLDDHPQPFIKFHKALVAVRAAMATPRDPDHGPDVRVYWGPTRTGKSARAHAQLPGSFSKQPSNRWWDGYTNGQSVIIDDFRDTWWDIDYMLRLLDIYPLKVNSSISELFLASHVTKSH